MKRNSRLIRGAIIATCLLTPASVFAVVFTGNVQFNSNLTIIGSISKGSGTFVIDDPLDPKNKLLFHSFVESPDVKNIYDGTAKLGATGSIFVVLPAYFEALNQDFRYQLTPIGAAMPSLHIEQEESGNEFLISGGLPGGKVSWQITGIRHDPYILAHPIVPEVDKGPGQIVDKGKYLCPECYGQ